MCLLGSAQSHASDTGEKKYTGIASQRPLGAAMIIYSGGPENHPCVHCILTLQVHKCFFYIITDRTPTNTLNADCTFYNAHCALHKYMRKRSNVVLYGEVHGAVHRNVLINVVKMKSILFQIF